MKRTINALCAVALMAVAALMASCSGKPAAGDESGVTVINGHRFVDLQLPSGMLWAETNVGAEEATDFGGLYSWGDTLERADCSQGSYRYGSEFEKMKKYNADDGKTVLDAADDAATAGWGEECRTPTEEEFKELADTTNCTWTWTKKVTAQNDTVAGYEVKSRRNGNSIFLPAAGARNAKDIVLRGENGMYWTSTVDSRQPGNAACLSFYFANYSWYRNARCMGGSVRPVASPRQDKDEAAPVPTLDVDSVVAHMTKDSTVECKFYVDYPVGDDSLALGVRDFIARELASTYIGRQTDDKAALAKYPVYKGSLASGKKLVDFYAKGTMRYLMAERKETESYCSGDIPPLYETVKINKWKETPGYVTYGVSNECYLGGAHGSYSFYYVNISKHTFKPVDKTVDASRVKELQPLLRKGVLWYFRECGETGVTKANLNDYLILPDNGLIPLPVCNPWVENDSLDFVYQQYEIAPYAAGLVSFKVALKDIKPYLTKEAKDMLGE